MTSHGVEASRLTAKGFGQDNPVGDNKTEEGRHQNRRVDFKIVKQVNAAATFATRTAATPRAA